MNNVFPSVATQKSGFSRRVLLVLSVGMIAYFTGAAAEHWRASHSSPSPTVSNETISQPQADVELIAITPEGVKLYRIQTPKAIVPTIIAVSPNNHHNVAIR